MVDLEIKKEIKYVGNQRTRIKIFGFKEGFINEEIKNTTIE